MNYWTAEEQALGSEAVLWFGAKPASTSATPPPVRRALPSSRLRSLKRTLHAAPSVRLTQGRLVALLGLARGQGVKPGQIDGQRVMQILQN